MSANPVASAIAQKHELGYHQVRIALNQLVNDGWKPFDAAVYIDEYLDGGWNLDRIVAHALEADR